MADMRRLTQQTVDAAIDAKVAVHDQAPESHDAASANAAAAAASTAEHVDLTTGAHGGIVADDDPRLTDARTPTSHAAAHASDGDDPVTPAAIGALGADATLALLEEGEALGKQGGALAGLPVGSGTAADITFSPAGTISATNVQAAIEEVAAEAGGGEGGAVASVNGQTGAVVLDSEDVGAASAGALTDHLADASSAHSASAISFAPDAGVAATDAQAAVIEVAADAAAASAAAQTAQQTAEDAQSATDAHAALETAAHGGIVADDDPRLTDTRAPAGAAGGVLSGSYPNPGFAADMATQAELDAHASQGTAAHGGIVADDDPRLTDGRAPIGAAGGVLSGSYPNPGFAADMATQAELDAVAAAKADLIGGKVPSSQIPAVALAEVYVVLDDTARDALVVQEGDFAVVTETSRTYVYDGSAWIELTAGGDVLSVNGETGVVVLSPSDVGAASASDLTAHIADGTDAHDASAISFSPSGSLAATNVQAAVDEASSDAASALAAHAADTTSVHGIADTADLVVDSDPRLSDSRAPSGAAGGVLSGSYPNPGFAVDMATQAELDAVESAIAALDAAALKTLRWSHTFTLPGPVAVDVLPGFYAPEAAGTAVALVAVRHAIGAGTQATWTLRRNGAAITGATAINSSSAAVTTDIADVAITADDYLDLDITGVSGSPEDLRVSLYFEVVRA